MMERLQEKVTRICQKNNIVLHMSLNCVRQQKPLIDIMTPRMAVSFLFTNNKIKSTTNRKFEINILFESI